MTIFLVRHAKAGERSDGPGDDRLRSLSRRGQRQAEGLVHLLEGVPVERILSSPYVRCLESVVPLASVRNLAIEPADALAEGATLEGALVLVRKHAHRNTVMCSHGDIVSMLLEHYQSRGVDLGPTVECPKGCTWVLDVDTTGDVIGARYLPPPPDTTDPDGQS